VQIIGNLDQANEQTMPLVYRTVSVFSETHYSKTHEMQDENAAKYHRAKPYVHRSLKTHILQ